MLEHVPAKRIPRMDPTFSVPALVPGARLPPWLAVAVELTVVSPVIVPLRAEGPLPRRRRAAPGPPVPPWFER